MNYRNDDEICYLDFGKAFNFANLRIRCAKISAPGVLPEMADWVRSFLANHSNQVRIDDLVSENAAISSGVPLGSNISPLLFLVMVNDLRRDLQLFCRMIFDDTKLGGR